MTDSMLNALDYGVHGDGTTNDAAAINSFLTTCIGQGAIAYFPGGKTYSLGGSTITVPDFSTIVCGKNAVFQRTADPSGGYASYANAMIVVGNFCRWERGRLDNSTVVATSATSFAPTNSSVTLTTQAGLPITPGAYFARVYSRSSPGSGIEGTVTAYSGTQLTIAAPFPFGSGTHSDWNINTGNVYQCPMVLHGVQGSVIDGVRVTGNWYVGILFDGYWSTPPAIATSYCTLRASSMEAVQNRGVYLYGTCNDIVVEDVAILGDSTTNYGINLNPANSSGTSNSIQGCRISNCSALNCTSQGFEIGDNCYYCTIENCSARAVSAGVGFLFQLANTGSPSYNKAVGCVAYGCATAGFYFVGCTYNSAIGCDAVACKWGFLINPSGSSNAQFIKVSGCASLSCTSAGFEVGANSNRCDVTDIQAISCGTGVQIDTGASVTLVTGRAYANTTALSDSGSGSNTSGLVTV